jgi:hypothetical protein
VSPRHLFGQVVDLVDTRIACWESGMGISCLLVSEEKGFKCSIS